MALSRSDEKKEAAMDTIANIDNDEVIEKEHLHEIDILYTKEQEEFMKRNKGKRQRRDAISSFFRKWPQKIVNYVINNEYSSAQQARIESQINILRNKTCLQFRRFVPGARNLPGNHINVFKGAGCFSYVGHVGIRQNLSLADRCLVGRVIIHEFVHALGFFHEQSRPDRDQFIRVFLDRVQPNRRNQYSKLPEVLVNSLGSPYDPISVMHYTTKAFATSDARIRGLPTMVYISDPTQRLGGTELSTEDLFQINRMYNCPQTSNNTTTASPTTSNSTTSKT